MNYPRWTSLLTALMLTGLTACGGGTVPTNPTTPPGASEPDPTPPADPTPPSGPTEPTNPATPVPGGPDLYISKVEFGQTVLRQDLALVGNKPALLRAYVLSSKSNVPASVQAQVYRNGQLLGNLPLQGPATLPTSEQPASLNQTFRGTLPAAWVSSGLEVRLAVDPDNAVGEANESNNARSVKPAVGRATVLKLRSVPIVLNGRTGRVTSPASLLVRSWPLAGVDEDQRAPLTYGGSVGPSSGWENLLDTLNRACVADASDRTYLGFVPVSYNSGIAGIAYVGAPTGLTWDYPTSAPGVSSHELGHTFGIGHAPCNVQGAPDYPVSDGRLDTWGYDASSGRLVDPANTYDVMSYCDPTWTSSYSYEKARTFLNGSRATVQSLASAQSGPVLLVSGHLEGDRVVLDPLLRLTSRALLPQGGDFELVLETASGEVRRSFAAYRSSEDGHPSFAFSLPDPGEVRSVRVLRGGAELYRAQGGVRPQSLSAAKLEASETASALQLSWNAQAYPYVAVAHLGAERSTLAVQLEGGKAELSTLGLEEGGTFEITLSDGMNSVIHRIQR
ncbi:hypothetical protein HNR42_001547 [Deinobacterium chartae]|uniref:Peptidase M66 n=1 Tax=Deinobacterium chartae TaxID=521158 RepID=A0A841I244_9DEIO|nr:M66 family metalloprotease [Deinobacterium chartae]MBB6098122.1 hypothetical protein [Deinobacterium chartae]